MPTTHFLSGNKKDLLKVNAPLPQRYMRGNWCKQQINIIGQELLVRIGKVDVNKADSMYRNFF